MTRLGGLVVCVLWTLFVGFMVMAVFALLSHARGEPLPAYPPAVCVTIAGKPEPCESREARDRANPGAIPAKYSPAQALEGVMCAKKNAKTLTDLEPCTIDDTPKKDDPANFMNFLYMFPAVVIRHDEGGVIRLYAERYKLLKDRMFIIDGDCNSACTLVLANKEPNLICATPRARFNFHAAYVVETGAYSPVATKWLMDAYPERVRAWINANGGLKAKDWLTVKATMFVDKCKLKEGV